MRVGASTAAAEETRRRVVAHIKRALDACALLRRVVQYALDALDALHVCPVRSASAFGRSFRLGRGAAGTSGTTELLRFGNCAEAAG